MGYARRPFWRYGIFQIPAIGFVLALIAALLAVLFGLGRPTVSVAIALDVSNSTHNGAFNAPGTIMRQEVDAVRAYLEENGRLKKPNHVQVFGFGGATIPLTQKFSDQSQEVTAQMDRSLLDRNLQQQVLMDSTEITVALQKTTQALQKEQTCREILLVTDGGGVVAPTALAEAVANRVRLNAIIVNNQSPEILAATLATQGSYFTGKPDEIKSLFVDRFFQEFNSNKNWVIICLGLAWIFAMWTVTLPLDRLVLQGALGMPFDLSGKIAIGNALFWTAATPGIVWRLLQLLNLPFLNQC